MFNLISPKCHIKWNSGREITFLQATMYFFVYNINTIGLYQKEKLTSTIDELAQKVSDALAAYCGFTCVQ